MQDGEHAGTFSRTGLTVHEHSGQRGREQHQADNVEDEVECMRHDDLGRVGDAVALLDDMWPGHR